jgi:hypothetical protein
VQAVFQNIPLHQLATVRFTKNQTTRSAADELTQHRSQGLGQIHHSPVPGIRVLRFHVVLKLSALGFLDNLQGAEIFMDGTNVEAECFPGPHRPTAVLFLFYCYGPMEARCQLATVEDVVTPRASSIF